jgi:hypothetical protein
MRAVRRDDGLVSERLPIAPFDDNERPKKYALADPVAARDKRAGLLRKCYTRRLRTNGIESGQVNIYTAGNERR